MILKRIEQNILTSDVINFNDLDDIKFLEVSYNTKPIVNIKKPIKFKIVLPKPRIVYKMNDFVIDENENFINDTTLFLGIEKENNKNGMLKFII